MPSNEEQKRIFWKMALEEIKNAETQAAQAFLLGYYLALWSVKDSCLVIDKNGIKGGPDDARKRI